ncbi:MAG: discoidin domain-containing protein [Planctomycetota bacterium]|nr:discoidin domain-containing protein [Planctomycetota bacterium]
MNAFLHATLVATLTITSIQAEDVSPKAVRALMVTGGCCHDYNSQKFTITEGIAARCGFPIEWTLEHSQNAKIPIYEKGDLSEKFDIIFHNECHAGIRDMEWINKILQPHREGIPAVVMHCNMHSYGFGRVEPYVKFLGIRSHRHGSHYPYTVEPIKPDHPILTKMGKAWKTPKGELYAVTEIMKTATPIAHALRLDGKKKDLYEVCMWTNEYEKCRVFGTTVGHHNETVETQEWMDTVARGFLWTLKRLDDQTFKAVSKDEHTKVIAAAKSKAGKSKPAPKAQVKKGAGKVKPNLATNKPTKASSNEKNKGNISKNAVDGNLGTRWCAANSRYPQWWQVDLGKPEHIKSLRIHWEKMYKDSRYTFKIEGSKDEKEWKMIVDETKPKKDNFVSAHVVDAPDTRFIKVTALKHSQALWASFWEFEAYTTEELPKTEKVLINRNVPKPFNTKGSVRVPDNYEFSMFAKAPEVSYPSAVACAPTGEVFVAVDQNGSLGKRRDVQQNILRLVDSDGDGKADKVNVFAEKVEDTTGDNKWMVFNGRGMFYDNGKLWVLHPPFVRVFEDTDGDGKADKNDLLISGISTQRGLVGRGGDHTTNGFRVGIDGWMYIAVGDFGFNNAVDKSGRKVVLQGGGIARVRLDGTELEIYARGLRNVYDVAVSPRLDLFTRDNTNDGGGWNVRLSHVIGGQAQYGYPRQFKNFKDEHIDCLDDYGGGSPCGSIFFDEPGLPGFGGLLTCDWGRSVVYHHPLTPNGAGFKAEQREFVKVSRPTDIDMDGSGRIYITSWHGGGFAFKNPNCGYVVRVTPKDFKPRKFPDLKKATDEELVGLMASESHIWRQHTQLEILRRGDRPVFADGMTKLAKDAQRNRGARIAAIFTLKQLQGAKSHPALVELTRDDSLREFALRALTDRLGENADVPVMPFVDALTDKNPRVRLQAAIGVGRLGKLEAAAPLTKLTADSDFLVAHVAVKSLVRLEAADAALAGVDGSNAAVRKGSLRALHALHKPEVVDGLIERLDSVTDVEAKKDLLSALARLHYREADYDGGWWGTRPDSRGPYYKPVKWEKSDAILERLMKSLSEPELVPFLLSELPRNRVEIKNSLNILLNLAQKKPEFRATAAIIFLESSKVPSQGIHLLKELAIDTNADSKIRVRILDGLMRTADIKQGFNAACEVASAVKETTGEMAYAREAFLRSPKHTKRLNLVRQAATGQHAALRSVAFAILNNLATSQLVKGKERDAIVGLVGELRSHANPAVKELAEKIILERPASDFTDETIGELKPEKLASIVAGIKGKPSDGQQLFMTQGCVACHTVSPNEPLKGPSLIDITKRYKPHEVIESILKPSARIAPAFASHWFQMKRGNVQHEGFVVRESGDEIEIRNIAGVSIIMNKRDIRKRGKRENSMMPDGLVQMLTPDQFASLLAYLKTLETK